MMKDVELTVQPTTNGVGLYSLFREENLRKIDEALYRGRKVILLAACLVPCVIQSTSTIAYFIFGSIALSSSVVFCFAQSVQQTNKKNKVNNCIRCCLLMNICDKITAFCFPIFLNIYLTKEVSVVSGVLGASLCSLFFYGAFVFERDYEKSGLMDEETSSHN